MESLKQYKMPIITIFVVTCVLLVFVALGMFGIIMSSDPDGLERTLIDWGVEEPEHIITPLLGFLENEFLIAIIGILFIVGISLGTFYLIRFAKKKKD